MIALESGFSECCLEGLLLESHWRVVDRIDLDGLCAGDGDALCWAGVWLAANFYRTVPDDGAGQNDRLSWLEIGLNLDAEDDPCPGIDRHFAVISRNLMKGKSVRDVGVIRRRLARNQGAIGAGLADERRGGVRDATVVHCVVRFVFRDRESKNGFIPCVAVFPMAPRESALCRVEENEAEDGAEDAVGCERCGCRCSGACTGGSGLNDLVSIAIKNGLTGCRDEVQGLIGDEIFCQLNLRRFLKLDGVASGEEVRKLRNGLADVSDDANHDAALFRCVWRRLRRQISVGEGLKLRGVGQDLQGLPAGLARQLSLQPGQTIRSEPFCELEVTNLSGQVGIGCGFGCCENLLKLTDRDWPRRKGRDRAEKEQEQYTTT